MHNVLFHQEDSDQRRHIFILGAWGEVKITSNWMKLGRWVGKECGCLKYTEHNFVWKSVLKLKEKVNKIPTKKVKIVWMNNNVNLNLFFPKGFEQCEQISKKVICSKVYIHNSFLSGKYFKLAWRNQVSILFQKQSRKNYKYL